MDACLPAARILWVFLAFSWAAGAGAETIVDEDLALAYGDKATVSIATGDKQALRRAPSVASVITAEDIVAMGATDLDEVLETVPGIHVNRTPNFYSPSYVIRGIFSTYNPQTLMLQNGVPMTTLFTGGRGNMWGGLPLENIARIEVIRGPGSALYGADAYSGVINIITKTAAGTPGTEVGVRAGSFNTRDSWVQHGSKLGPVDVAAYFRFGRTDGWNETVARDKASASGFSLAPGSLNLGLDAIDGSLALAYENWQFHGGYKLRENMETGAGVSSALDPIGRGKSERFNADLSWNNARFAENWGLGFSASYLQYSEITSTYFQLLPPKPTFPDGQIGAPDKWERQLRLSASAIYDGFADHRLRLGVGHDDLDLYRTATHKNYTFVGVVPTYNGVGVLDYSNDPTQAFMLPQRRKVNYAYAQDEWRLAPDWTLTAGVRRDAYSDVGSTTNPRLALVWDARYNLTAKILYGHAFRAPSFNELYSINNPVVRGNPSLRPETISTLEAAVSWQPQHNLELNLSVFHYEMKDIIRTVAAVYQNTGKQHGNGYEVEAVYDLGASLRLTGNYSRQVSIDESTGVDAGYAPRNHIYGRADWRFAGGWLASTQINWVADRRRAAGDTRPAVPDYTTVDVTLRSDRRGSNKWNFAASVRNLFDADAREPNNTDITYDLPVSPRTLWLQLSYQL